ncbi:ester cyclase [Streptacidiphilus sp. PAMC 29251]
MSTTDTNTAVVERFLDEVVNQGNLDLIDELWAPDMRWSGGSLGEIDGIEAYKAMMRGSGAGRFIDLHLVVKDIYTKDDQVVVQFTNSGRRTGRLFGIIPFTSKHATWNGVGVYRVVNGRISDGWFVEDVAAMMRQLGAVAVVSMLTSR